MIKFFWLGLGIFFEIIALIFMKRSDGFTKLTPILLVFLFYTLALGCLILTLQKMDTSVAYAIWAGGGIMAMAVVGIFFMNEPVSVLKIVSIILIVLGVVGLELFD